MDSDCKNLDVGVQSNLGPTSENSSRRKTSSNSMIARCLLIAVVAVGIWCSARWCEHGIHLSSASEHARVEEQPEFHWSQVKPSKRLEYHACFDGLQCARLVVPMDYRRMDGRGRTVAIALARLPAKVPVTDPRYGGVLLTNPGGPGGSGVQQVIESGRNFQTIIDSEKDPWMTYDSRAKYYDVIGFDPRGVNNTTPGINCFPNLFSRQNWELQVEAEGQLGSSPGSLMQKWARTNALAPSCSEQNVESHDGHEGDEIITEHMNTTPVVQDMVTLIERHGEWREKQGMEDQNLHDAQNGPDANQTILKRTQWNRGHEKLHFWGRSYGTILGSTFAAMHPDRVGRLVLDGVINITEYYDTRTASNVVDADAVFDRFSEYCNAAGPTGCPMYTPGGSGAIKNSTHSLIASLYTNPIAVTGTASRGPEVITWTDAMTVVRYAVYVPIKMFPVMALLFGALRQGYASPMADFKQFARTPVPISDECRRAGPYSPECTGVAEEMAGTLGVLCTDSVGFTTFDVEAFTRGWMKQRNDSEMMGDIWAQLALGCVGWRARAKWRFTGPLYTITSHPLLFVSNTLDPISPLQSAYLTSSYFPFSVVLEQEAEGHTTLSAPSLCTAKSIRMYFQTGKLPHPGTVCAGDFKPLLGPSSAAAAAYESGNGTVGDGDGDAGDRVLSSAVADEVRRYRDVKNGPFFPM